MQEKNQGAVAAAAVVREEEEASTSTIAALSPESASTWCALHGLLVVSAGGGTTRAPCMHAPVTLRPLPLDAACFHSAVSLAVPFNGLVDRVAMDTAYLETALADVERSDAFTARIMRVWRAARAKKGEHEYANQLRLGLLRSDYMLDESQNRPRLRQIELNTISSSFGPLASLVSEMHATETPGLPRNDVPNEFAHVMAATVRRWEIARDPSAGKKRSSAVLFVVQPNERNMYDQLWLAEKLRARHGITSLRATLAEIAERAIVADDGTLSFEGSRVSLVYYRAGYSPDDYFTEVEWDARLLLECSNAVCCPNAGYHLAGCKKVQQDLAEPGKIEQFVDTATAELLRSSFAGLWSLDDPESPIIAEAIAKPDAFVLKPQREGGGNNLYGEELHEALRKGIGLEAFILMERIMPRVHADVPVMRNGEMSVLSAITELGIYSAVLADGDDGVVVSRQCGHLLRTKASSSDEGGVAAGYAYIDSPFLVDDDQ